MAGVKLSRTAPISAAGQRFYLKRRRWYAGALIWAAAQLPGSTFAVLPRSEWLLWEPYIYDLAYGWQVSLQAPGQLRLPEIPGSILTVLLRSALLDVQTKMDALSAAVEALERLHRLWVRFPDGIEGRFSHGDATTDNVIYDPAGGRARWFDLETVHDSRRPREWRQADDLRAFAYSAAASLPEMAFPSLARSILTSYTDRAVLRALSQIIECVQRRPGAFHFAQTGISCRKNNVWSAVLQAALEARLQSLTGKPRDRHPGCGV